MVRACTLSKLDPSHFPYRVMPKSLKQHSLFDAYHKCVNAENKTASQLIVPLHEALNGTILSSWGKQTVRPCSLPIAATQCTVTSVDLSQQLLPEKISMNSCAEPKIAHRNSSQPAYEFRLIFFENFDFTSILWFWNFFDLTHLETLARLATHQTGQCIAIFARFSWRFDLIRSFLNINSFWASLTTIFSLRPFLSKIFGCQWWKSMLLYFYSDWRYLIYKIKFCIPYFRGGTWANSGNRRRPWNIKTTPWMSVT